LATAGYRYTYKQAEGPILRRRWKWTLSLLLRETEASSVREREMRVKDSPSRGARTVEPAYLPRVPATALTPGALRHKLNPLSPSSGERSRFLENLTLIVLQGSRKCDHDC